MFGPESIIYCSYHLTTNSAFQMGEKATVRDPLLFLILFIFSAVKLNSFFKIMYILEKVVTLWALIHHTPVYNFLSEAKPAGFFACFSTPEMDRG